MTLLSPLLLLVFLTNYLCTIQSQILALDNLSFDHTTTENMSISRDYSVSTCNIADTDKVDCGFASMTEDECYYRNCCYQPIAPNPNNYTWCYHTNTHSTTSQIGWIKMISCIEAQSNAQFTYYYNDSILSELAQYAVTIKIVPPGGTSNPAYTTYAVMAVPCSNPIYALNNNKELSWVIDMNGNYKISDLANYQDNWIGTTTATNRLRNSCFATDCCPISNARDLIQIIYTGSCVSTNIHISPKQSNPGNAQCEWNYHNRVNQDIEVYFGFDVNKMYFCNHTTPNPTYAPTVQPTVEPTINPTLYPTVLTLEPTVDPTLNPTFHPTLDPTTNKPSKAPSSEGAGVVETTSIHSTAVRNDGNQNNESHIINDGLIIYVVIGVGGILLLICCFIFLYHIKKQKQKSNDDINGNYGIEIEKMQSVSGTTPMTTDNIDIGEDMENVAEIDNDGNETDNDDLMYNIENNDGIVTKRATDGQTEMQYTQDDDSDDNEDEDDSMYDKNKGMMDGNDENGNRMDIETAGNVDNENNINDDDNDDDDNDENDYDDLYKTPSKPTSKGDI